MPVQFNFVASIGNENITGKDVLDGETNQIMNMLEKELLELCEIVIGEEEFDAASSATNGTEGTSTTSDEPKMRSMRRTLRRGAVVGGMMGRMLVVEKCISATVDEVRDIGKY